MPYLRVQIVGKGEESGHLSFNQEENMSRISTTSNYTVNSDQTLYSKWIRDSRHGCEESKSDVGGWQPL